MFNRTSQNSMNTPLAEGIPMGKSPLVRGDYFIFLALYGLVWVSDKSATIDPLNQPAFLITNK